ncbi:helix-turn-helix domain-containing protein [Epibacterium ulvae]|uniref:helix-turn-helix domain-containing protein n=1 Tax=Epibacterium ulvae TaxID=1156985 RepID=UPI00248F8D63|nr:helix-turn-helix domain-containing protein [Epibacterium ulvae]
MRTDTHNAKVLVHLQSGRSITQQEAFRKLGCFRLSARICELRKAGHSIQKQMIEVETSDGTSARVAEYFIQEAT